MRKMKCIPEKISKSLYSLYSKKLQEDFSSRNWKVTIFISFVPTKEAKQRKTPDEYKLLKLVNTAEKY